MLVPGGVTQPQQSMKSCRLRQLGGTSRASHSRSKTEARVGGLSREGNLNQSGRSQTQDGLVVAAGDRPWAGSVEVVGRYRLWLQEERGPGMSRTAAPAVDNAMWYV